MHIQESISVVIPAYNHENYIEEALMSVYNQTYQNIELVIINDGSTDETQDRIDSFLEKNSGRFSNVISFSQPNLGVSATLNKAVSVCTSEWIYLLASDDLFLPEKIEIQQKAINDWNNPELALVYTDTFYINSDGSQQPLVNRWCPDPGVQYNAYEWLYIRTIITTSTVGIRKEALLDIGLFDESLSLEDWDCWLRLSVKYPIARTPQRLSKYRYHQNNTSHDRSMVHNNIIKTLDKFLSQNKELVTEDMQKERYIREAARYSRLKG